MPSALPCGTRPYRSALWLDNTSLKIRAAAKSGLLGAGESKRKKCQQVRQIAIEDERIRRDRPQVDVQDVPEACGAESSRSTASLAPGRGRIYIARDHENRIVRRIPLAVELLQHLGGGLIERLSGAERILLVWGSRE